MSPDLSALAPRYRDWPWKEPWGLACFALCCVAPAVDDVRSGEVHGYLEVAVLIGVTVLVARVIAPGAIELDRSGVAISGWRRRRELPWADVLDVRVPGAWPVPFEGGPSGLVCRSGEVVRLPGMPRAARRRLAAALTAWRSDPPSAASA